MSGTQEIFAVLAGIGGVGGAYAIWDGVRKRITAKAQGDVAVSSAIALLKPLQERVDALNTECGGLRTECAGLRNQVGDLSAEVEHQRLVINDSTVKLEAANRRADYYQHAFDQRAGN
jgi:hypothetical protein